MKITFPHLGNTYIAAKILFDSLGLEYVIPPPSNQKALQLGALHSPEEICLPFKIMIGNYIQSIEQGADTILLVGSCGPCRFGQYAELQMRVIRNLGYDVRFIVLDHVGSIGWEVLYRRIRDIVGESTKSRLGKVRSLKYAYQAIRLMDDIEKMAHGLAGYEMAAGKCKAMLKQCKKEVVQENNPYDAITLLMNFKRKMAKIAIDKRQNPLRIAIIGEIYTVIEPFSNLYIEDHLMDMGVSSVRRLTPTWWINDMLLKKLRINSVDLKRASNQYLPYYIGGHARECIGEAVLTAEEGFDGIIQIFPMGCMPEIVSKSILPTISRDKECPVLTLVVDEMTGEAGYMTRIEAFVDLLLRRRENVCVRC